MAYPSPSPYIDESMYRHVAFASLPSSGHGILTNSRLCSDAHGRAYATVITALIPAPP